MNPIIMSAAMFAAQCHGAAAIQSVGGPIEQEISDSMGVECPVAVRCSGQRYIVWKWQGRPFVVNVPDADAACKRIPK